MSTPDLPASSPVAVAAPTTRRQKTIRQHEEPQANGLADAAQRLLHETDAARYIGMSVAFLRQARIRARGPAYFRIGRSVRYRLSDLDTWLSLRRVTTRDQAV
jgi:hypothetical protein